jgi:transposase-like protein
MFQLESNVSEIEKVFKEIMENPEKMFELFQFDMKQICEKALVGLLQLELSEFLGREKYERIKDRQPNYRNGSYERLYTVKNIGTLHIQVPRDRNGQFQSKLLKRYERYDKALEKDIALMYLSGLSTRGISLISKTLIGRKISASEVSKVTAELLHGIEAWRQRPLDTLRIQYMYIDGVNLTMRVDNRIEKVPILVVIGVTECKHNRGIKSQQQHGERFLRT